MVEIYNILIFSTANFISMFGTSCYTFAISLYVLQITGSGLSFSLTLASGLISSILVNPFAGVIADKFNKKTILILMDFICGIIFIILFIISEFTGLKLSMVYISTFLINGLSTIYSISSEAAKPNLVTEEKLMSINSISKIIESASSIIGPAIGGLIFAFVNIRIFILINAISFIISGILELFLSFNFTIIYTNQEINLFNDIKEGFYYILRDKKIMNTFFILVFINFFIGLSINIPLPYIINSVLKLGSKKFGIIEAAFPIGMIAGALLIKRIDEKNYFNKLLKYSFISLGICTFLIGTPISAGPNILNSLLFTLYYSIIMLILGIAISFIDIPLFYWLQKNLPENYRGRVISIGISMAKVVVPVALIVSGSLVNITPPYLLPFIGGTCLLFASYRFSKESFKS